MDLRRTLSRKITGPLVPALSKLGLTPDMLSWLGLVITLVAAAFIGTGNLLVGGILILVAGLFDILDGALARYSHKATLSGAILDSTFDRISEAALLLGLLIYNLRGAADSIVTILIFVTLITSFLVSYIRARAEGLGVDCKVGLFTRAERVIILALGLLANQVLIVLAILAFFSLVTVIHRFIYAYRKAREKAQVGSNDLP